MTAAPGPGGDDFSKAAPAADDGPAAVRLPSGALSGPEAQRHGADDGSLPPEVLLPVRSQKSTPASLSTALQDPDSPVFTAGGGKRRPLGFCGYFICCFVATSASNFLAFGLWSEMGCGVRCLHRLQDQSRYGPLTAGIALTLAVGLYMVDFFVPPHLPGSYCALYRGDRWLGRVLIASLGLLVIVTCLLVFNTYPTVPLSISIFLCPIGIMLVRHFTMPAENFRQDPDADIKSRNFQERMAMLRVVTGEERNQNAFFRAATGSFILVGLICLGVWIPWAVDSENKIQTRLERADRSEKSTIFVFWAAPLMIAFANFVFAAFAFLRVALNEAYAATDQVKNKLIVGQANSSMNNELMHHRMAMLQKAFKDEMPDSPKKIKTMMAAQDRMQRYLIQHISHMRQLSAIVKTVGCAFIVILGALYVVFQLTAADGEVAHIVQGFSTAFFITFIVFVYVAFHRLWQCMHGWLRDLPLWASAVNTARSSPFRALLLVVAAPLGPIVLALSAANQAVRRCRGLAGPRAEQDAGDSPAADVESGAEKAQGGATPRPRRQPSRFLTDRVNGFIASLEEWDWMNVTYWLYIWAFVVIIWKLVPVLLNVMLSWMSAMMGNQNFVVILAFTFAAGMVLFMLPPVPGPPIYLFGGFVISDKCPYGFWWGTIICVVLCFVLKLTACAVQQVCIGMRLGNRMSVKQTVGVHKPFIRAIESVLRRPGLSIGKCAILCGGPDWPTSVLAGILRLSVFQCALGTCPIIINLIPLALTGSFYLKRVESEVWTRAGNLMFTLTVLTSVLFWAGMGWAIQNEFDTKQEELTAPKEEYLELDWLDHRQAYITKRSVVSWDKLPRYVKVAFTVGAIGNLLVSQAFFWRFKMLVGTFNVTDEIDSLVFYGSAGLIKPACAICLILVGLSSGGLICYRGWCKAYKRPLAAAAAKELESLEADWKERRLEEARAYAQRKAAGGKGTPKNAGFGSDDAAAIAAAAEGPTMTRQRSKLDEWLEVATGAAVADALAPTPKAAAAASGAAPRGLEGLEAAAVQVELPRERPQAAADGCALAHGVLDISSVAGPLSKELQSGLAEASRLRL